MATYECPNCGGGFPEYPPEGCPWCEQKMDGSYSEDNTTSESAQAQQTRQKLSVQKEDLFDR